MRRLVVLPALLLLVAAVPGPRVADARPSPPQRAPHFRPAFNSMPCPDFFPKGRDVDCGFVRVPEDRTKPHGRTITVAAAVVHANTSNPRPDPVVFLDGGPSFGAISPFALSLYFGHWPFAHDRDLILVDTRGTGLSRPRLGCPELDSAEVRAFYAPPYPNAQAYPIETRALQACWRRLVAAGVDPAAYTTAESAADLEALRRALGVRRWNLVAASADGVLGATYVRLYPDHVRSAVYDSTISPQVRYGIDFDRGNNQLLERIFRTCRSQPKCQARYPHIAARFRRTMNRLQRHPVTIRLGGFQPHAVTLLLDGAGVFSDAVSMIYPGDLFGTPSHLTDPLRYIARVSNGHFQKVYEELLGTGPVTNEHRDDSLAQGKTMSYVCHDLVNFLDRSDLVAAVRDLPEMRERYLAPHYDLALGYLRVDSPAGCRSWPVGRAPESQHRPFPGRVPSLLLAGEYDANVSPYVVKQMLRGLHHAYYYRIPASSHLQLASYTNGHTCARAIAAAFLTDPSRAPDSTCLATVPPAVLVPTAARHQSWSPGRPVRMTWRPGGAAAG